MNGQTMQQIGPVDCPLIDDSTDWWPVLLDGSLGAFIGALTAVAVALYVVHRQTTADRALAKEERANAACLAVLSTSQELARSLAQINMKAEDAIHKKLRPVTYDDIQPLATLSSYMLPSAQIVGVPYWRPLQTWHFGCMNCP